MTMEEIIAFGDDPSVTEERRAQIIDAYKHAIVPNWIQVQDSRFYRVPVRHRFDLSGWILRQEPMELPPAVIVDDIITFEWRITRYKRTRYRVLHAEGFGVAAVHDNFYMG